MKGISDELNNKIKEECFTQVYNDIAENNFDTRMNTARSRIQDVKEQQRIERGCELNINE